ncbi:MAG: sec-independent protein translocase protein TatB [Candidatus Azotimanducaceae bacterium]|jgi:sec-independent protein translocase protein TatB
MFDVGFPELLLVSVVALLVIGPERLPETVRTIMIWLGKIKRSFANIKTEIEQEIGVDEIRQKIHNDTIMKDLDEGRDKIQSVFDDIQQDVKSMQSIHNPNKNEPSKKTNLVESNDLPKDESYPLKEKSRELTDLDLLEAEKITPKIIEPGKE